MQVGYARVSTIEQNLHLQEDALKNAGCEKIFHDTVSGAKPHRPGLENIMEFLRKGDVLVVWRLDRLGRSLFDLLEIVTHFEIRGIGFRSITESIDTTTSSGKLVFQIFGAIAEFERNLIRERTTAGLNAARKRGRCGGRPRVLDTQKIELAKRLYEEKQHSIKEICSIMGITKPCLYDYIRERHKTKKSILNGV